MDPLTWFAFEPATASAQGAIVYMQLRVAADGNLRELVMTSRYADPRGTIRELADHEQRMSWKAPTEHAIAAPSASEVTVVGLAFAMRRGVGGRYGVQGRMDQISTARLNWLRAHLPQRTRRASLTHHRHRVDESARSNDGPSPEVLREAQRERTTREALYERIAALGPQTPADLADNERCTPYWPSSGRPVDRTVAEAAPAKFGWRCLFDDKSETGYSVAPGRDPEGFTSLGGWSGSGPGQG